MPDFDVKRIYRLAKAVHDAGDALNRAIAIAESGGVICSVDVVEHKGGEDEADMLQVSIQTTVIISPEEPPARH